MSHRARLATACLIALAVRAAVAQQPYPTGQRGDPYAPQGVASQYQPQSPQPAVPNQALRYPLPAGAAIPAAAVSPPGVAPSLPTGPIAPATGTGSDVFQPGMTVARVGDKTIFYGEAAAVVNLMLDPYLAKAKSEAELAQIKSQIESEREAVTKNVVKLMVQSKVYYHEFDREMRSQLKGDATKYAEAKSGMNKKIRSYFEKALGECREKLLTATPEQIEKLQAQDPTVTRLAVLMKERQLESMGELDTVLRQFGTTLDQQIAAFGEHQLGMQAVIKNIKRNPEVTHQEMLDYYRERATDYALPAKVRFEILSVKFVNFPTRQAAREQISQMGNAVFLGGTKFAAVAVKSSQEPNAASGGYYDWINQGSLASKAIDQALFSIDIDKLSQIIEDETGYHIVRVKERQPAGQVSFLEAQQEIKEAIQVQKRSAEQKKFLQELQARTTIWTIYDDATAGVPAATQQR